MIAPHSGLMAMYEGRAYEFLHCLDKSLLVEIWRVRPLFVAEPDRDITFHVGHRLTALHTKTR